MVWIMQQLQAGQQGAGRVDDGTEMTFGLGFIRAAALPSPDLRSTSIPKDSM